MITDEGIDWWSKYYASIGETDKCRHYLELGYDKMQVPYSRCHYAAVLAGSNNALGRSSFSVCMSSPSVCFDGFPT